nr:MAG TPA: hypothetical protein [Caudoviricetes sp.]
MKNKLWGRVFYKSRDLPHKAKGNKYATVEVTPQSVFEFLYDKFVGGSTNESKDVRSSKSRKRKGLRR